MDNEQQQLDFLDILTLINFILNFTAVSNDKLMNELRYQDKQYLDKINKKLDYIIEYIDGKEN